MPGDSAVFGVQLADDHLDPMQIEDLSTMLRHEIRQEWGNVISESGPASGKGLDPVFGALVITIVPSAIAKFLEFLHDWAMRRENRHVKIKIQMPGNSALELEVPQTSSPHEVSVWIQLVKRELTGTIRRGPRRR